MPVSWAPYAAVTERNAGWLVTVRGTQLDRLVAGDAAHFVPQGEICSGGDLWWIVPPS